MTECGTAEAIKVAKGRHRPGEQHHNAKLDDKKVEYILSSPKSGMELARELGVHNSQIYRIRKGERWSHVTPAQTGQND